MPAAILKTNAEINNKIEEKTWANTTSQNQKKKKTSQSAAPSPLKPFITALLVFQPSPHCKIDARTVRSHFDHRIPAIFATRRMAASQTYNLEMPALLI
jgi:hypothetical protein